MKEQIKGINYQHESAALMSSHLRISMNYHELLREFVSATSELRG